jgi:hypothetical protein
LQRTPLSVFRCRISRGLASVRRAVEPLKLRQS